MHEVGYTVVALGDGSVPVRFAERPAAARGGARPDRGARDRLTVGSRRGRRSSHPTWGGERLDLRLLIDAMVANTVLASGHRPPDVPVSEIPRIVREAVGWPMSGAA